MGQAKQRGTQEQRAAHAKSKIDALRPERLVCGACKTAFTNFDSLDTRNMPGIHGIYSGICPSCGESVFAFSGEKNAVANAMIAWQDTMVTEGKLGMQSRDGNHIAFEDQEKTRR